MASPHVGVQHDASALIQTLVYYSAAGQTGIELMGFDDGKLLLKLSEGRFLHGHHARSARRRSTARARTRFRTGARCFAARTPLEKRQTIVGGANRVHQTTLAIVVAHRRRAIV